MEKERDELTRKFHTMEQSEGGKQPMNNANDNAVK
jgi:hypothetical protein